jgi:hypothetical protein
MKKVVLAFVVAFVVLLGLFHLVYLAGRDAGRDAAQEACFNNVAGYLIGLNAPNEIVVEAVETFCLEGQ